MSTGWDDHEPAPLEFFHGQVNKYFHEYRKSKGEATDIMIDGIIINTIVAKAKVDTYKKYPKQVNQSAILKTDI